MANPYDPQSGYPVPSNGVPDPYGAHQSGAYPPPYPGVPPVGGYGVPPASNMGWGIAACVVGGISTFSCCLGIIALVCGVVALVKGSSVGSAWAVGDFAGAQRNADDAKKFGMIGTIVGGVMVLLSIIMWIAYFAFLASTGAT
ncbi:hypothetical protein GCM10010528_09210 [Gordonia defluvii]|jgi:hypothetical protein|uniref:Interferon-induced transmembrane protein n=1 Tax=Gordonia defluvii TaxID=283718 RepID=A0ABP6L1H3_9ACTN|nr:CD225/dispanin family protein [Gordonia sp. UBA5067]